MTGLSENERSRYVETLERLGIWQNEAEKLFTARDKCAEELTGMKDAVSKLQPVPEYWVYGRAVPLYGGSKFLFHCTRYRTFTEAFLKMYEGDHGFSVDSNGQIVLTGFNVSIPKVEVYDPGVIITGDTYLLPEGHISRKLFSHASTLVNKVGTSGHHYYEFQRLLLCEGFGENIGNIY